MYKRQVYEGEGTGEIALQNLSFGPGVYEVTVDYRAAEGTSSVISVAEQEYGRRRLYVNDIPLQMCIRDRDVKDKDYGRSFIPLTIGFTGLIQSHLLTCELVGGFTILLCLILWKKVFRKETFLVLAKTVVYSVLLSAWFLVPFLDLSLIHI